MRFVSSMNSPLAPRMSSLSLTGGVKRGLERGNSSSSMGNCASVGTSTSVLAKECSSQTNSCGRSYMNMGMHASSHSGFGVLPQSGAGYETMGWNMDAGNITRSGKSLTGRFNSGYGYEVDGAYCMVSALIYCPVFRILKICDIYLATGTSHPAVPIANATTTFCYGSRQLAHF